MLDGYAERFKADVEAEKLSKAELKKHLCSKSGGKVNYCRNQCNWQCPYGKALIRAVNANHRTAGQQKHANSITQYIEACKSGNPIVYLLETGMSCSVQSARVNWCNAKKRYASELAPYFDCIRSTSTEGTKYSHRKSDVFEGHDSEFTTDNVKGQYAKYSLHSGQFCIEQNGSMVTIDRRSITSFINELNGAVRIITKGEKR